MYASLIITFLLILGIIVTSLQNSVPLELKFLAWDLKTSLTALIFYSSLVGAAVVAILSLPKLVSKHFKVRSLTKELQRLKERNAESEKRIIAPGKPDVGES